MVTDCLLVSEVEIMLSPMIFLTKYSIIYIFSKGTEVNVQKITFFQVIKSCRYCFNYLIKSLLFFSVLFSVYTPFHEEGNISQARKAGEAIANAFIVIGVVLVLTIILVVLYKFRCYCVSISTLIYLLVIIKGYAVRGTSIKGQNTFASTPCFG